MKKCWCGNTDLKEYSNDYFVCTQCNTLVNKNAFDAEAIDNVKDEKEDLYGSHYWKETMLKTTGKSSLSEVVDMYLNERCVYWLRYVLQYCKLGGDVVEIGCGLGQFQYLLKEMGYKQTAYELSPEICEYMRNELDINVVCGEFKAGINKYDSVLAFDLFEHITDPGFFLKEIEKSLSTDGIICMQTPCYDPELDYEDMLIKKPRFKEQLRSEQHVFLYSKESIVRILKEFGFNYIVFEPACFGDDYDMFLFASREEIAKNSKEEIDGYLNSVSAGRLGKAIITLDETVTKKNKEIALFEKAARERLDVIGSLEKDCNTYKNAADERLAALNTSSRIIYGLEDHIRNKDLMIKDKETIIKNKDLMIKDKETIIKNKDGIIRNVLTINIGINIITLYPGKIGGAEQYVRNVIKEMSNIDYLNVFVFVNDNACNTFKSYKNISVIKIDLGPESDEQLLYHIDYNNIDVMFCPLFFASPSNCPVPVVASILDVQHEFYPQYFERRVLKDIRKNTFETLNSVNGIITISEYSKQTIIDKYKVPSNKISVTYLDSDSAFQMELLESEKERIRSEIADNYIFYPANSWPHKNHINLLKSYLVLKNRYHISHKLVFTGDSKQKKEEIQRFIEDNGLLNDVIYLGYRKQEDMPYIFACAAVLVFPSLFEGFGIPLVEAMRTGTAIACSSCGSIPEVARDAALYFDAKNPEDIAEKVYQLLVDESLRKDLIAKGRMLAQNYSWEKCANDTVKYLRTIANKTIPSAAFNREKPLVSIVTPSYNQGEFIRQTIESVLSQDYPNIEYIVMDGGSTDNTIDLLKEYGDRIKWYSEKDKGQGDAVNKGIKLAQGSIIGWLNSDDTYLEGAISKVVDYFMSHPNTGMVYGEAYYTDKSGEITERYPTMHYNKGVLASNCFICQPAAFFKRDAALQAGLIDISYQCSMDYEFWMRMANSSKISYIPDYIATSRLYEENKTLSRREEVFTECCKAAKTNFGYVPISWCDGYADYKADGQRNTKFYLYRNYYLLKYNFDNIQYLRNTIKDVSGLRLKTRIKHLLRIGRDSEFVGQYEDGWLSRKYITTIANDSGKKLIVSGIKAWPLKEHLVIKVFINGTNIGKIDVGDNSDFSRTIQIPNGLHHNNQLEVKLMMNKTFNPSKIADSSDTRELSFILKELVIGDE